MYTTHLPLLAAEEDVSVTTRPASRDNMEKVTVLERIKSDSV